MIIGHKKQWDFLRKSFQLGRIPHALLFEGQEKLGKRAFALEFIKLINCQKNEISNTPCQKCVSCTQIEKKLHPDFILIKPLKEKIQISQIRNLALKLASKPSLGTFKTAIIDNAHLMTQEAQSSLLKTLEEPKGDAILILITQYPERLLPTILSRVQRIKFYPVGKLEMKKSLISKGLSVEKAEKLVKISFGKPGRIIEFLQNPAKLQNQKEKISDLVKLLNAPLVSRFLYAQKNSFNFEELKEILETWMRYFREKLLERISTLETEKKKFQSQYSLSQIEKILKVLQEINYYILNTNVNSRLALETLMLEL